MRKGVKIVICLSFCFVAALPAQVTLDSSMLR